MRRLALAAALICAAATAAHAHKPSDAQLHLDSTAGDGDGTTLTGRLDVSLRDLDAALGLDANGNGDITWAEVTAAAPRIAAYAQARLAVTGDGKPCAVTVGAPPALVDLIDGAYWAGPLTVRCPTHATELAITYKLLFDLDAQHRGILHVDGAIAVARDATPVKLALGPVRSSTPPVLAGAAAAGTGIDHLVILALAVLPLGRFRRRKPRGAALPAAIATDDAVARVTAFVAGQVFTLALIAYGQLMMPPALVDLAIAVTAGALLLYVAVLGGAVRWTIALELGLLHGFGLAHAFAHVAPRTAPLRALIGFSLGAALTYGAIAAALFALERAITPRPGT